RIDPPCTPSSRPPASQRSNSSSSWRRARARRYTRSPCRVNRTLRPSRSKRVRPRSCCRRLICCEIACWLMCRVRAAFVKPLWSTTAQNSLSRCRFILTRFRGGAGRPCRPPDRMKDYPAGRIKDFAAVLRWGSEFSFLAEGAIPMVEAQREQQFDVVVVGSGAGGVTAAIVAAKHGLRTVIVEKSRLWGGSSGLSGGGLWIPNNPVSVAAGLQDSFDEALTYMETVIGDVGPASSRERKVAFLQKGPEMVRFLQDEGVPFVPAMEYPDYYPDKPGGKIGRSIEADFFDLRRLGSLGDSLRRSPVPIPFYSGEAHYLPK